MCDELPTHVGIVLHVHHSGPRHLPSSVHQLIAALFDVQAGSCTEHTTSQQVFGSINYLQAQKTDQYVCCIDIAKAFPSTPQPAIMAIMWLTQK